MAQILGITDSGESEAFWSENARRMVFHQYPQGAAPLTGLLSLMGSEGEDKTKFGWWEDRMDPHKSETVITAAATNGGPFDTGAGADEADPFSAVATDTLRIYVADYTQFRIRDVVWIKDALTDVAAKVQIKGVITAEPSTSGHITIRLQEDIDDVANDGTNLGLDVFVIGSATPEGDRSKTGANSRPIEIENFMQIFRTAFSFTASSLKGGLRYDDSGEYKEKAKKNALRHSILLEFANFWGVKTTDNVATVDGPITPEKKMAGVEWYLKQWELGNIANGAEFDYRSGTDITASAWDADDNKRILDINGTVTKTEFNSIIKRAFDFTNDESFTKLCLCDGGFISVFNEFIDNTSVVKRRLFDNGKAGFSFTEWESPHGTVMFKSHPLFNRFPAFANSAFILDMGNLKYKHLNDRDTDILTNREANDADLKKDEWLTEGSLEVNFPESHMYIKGLNGIVA